MNCFSSALSNVSNRAFSPRKISVVSSNFFLACAGASIDSAQTFLHLGNTTDSVSFVSSSLCSAFPVSLFSSHLKSLIRLIAASASSRICEISSSKLDFTGINASSRCFSASSNAFNLMRFSRSSSLTLDSTFSFIARALLACFFALSIARSQHFVLLIILSSFSSSSLSSSSPKTFIASFLLSIAFARFFNRLFVLFDRAVAFRNTCNASRSIVVVVVLVLSSSSSAFFFFLFVFSLSSPREKAIASNCSKFFSFEVSSSSSSLSSSSEEEEEEDSKDSSSSYSSSSS